MRLAVEKRLLSKGAPSSFSNLRVLAQAALSNPSSQILFPLTDLRLRNKKCRSLVARSYLQHTQGQSIDPLTV